MKAKFVSLIAHLRGTLHPVHYIFCISTFATWLYKDMPELKSEKLHYVYYLKFIGAALQILLLKWLKDESFPSHFTFHMISTSVFIPQLKLLELNLFVI